MKVERRTGNDERRIATGMVVSTPFLGLVAARWEKEGLFGSEWANIVGKMCVDYYNRYGKAPSGNIEGIAEQWADDFGDKETAGLVTKFLGVLSREYEREEAEANPDYLKDLAGKYFNRVKLLRLSEKIQADIDTGRIEDADKAVTQWGRVEVGAGAGVDVFQDTAAVDAAFDSDYEAIVKYDGAIGEFFGNSLQRDGLIAFMGPEKRGKTFWLLDVAWQAMLQRRRVAFFEVGDLSQNQVIHRMGVRAARWPLKPGKVRRPLGIHPPADIGEEATIPEYSEREFETGLTRADAKRAFAEVMERQVRSQNSYFRLSVHPNDSITVHGVRSIVQGWERRGWVPDVIVIDYADILAPPHGVAESRDQINKTWKQLRALSQEMHCLVVTATQTDAASYMVNTIGRSNFSEDKRKFAHVTGMIGLNATPSESEAGIMRLNWVVRREAPSQERRCVHVAGCLAIGRPVMYSVY